MGSDLATTTRSKSGRPNIVLILVDDMGYSDIGCYGAEIATPNLDRLAANGVRFTQMYNCARCCPSRATLLTGLYPHQAGVGHMVQNRGIPAYQGYLNQQCVTIAEVLGSAGYLTYMSGKWHVGGPYSPLPPPGWYPGKESHPLPIQRGFHQHFGTLGGAGSYFNPPVLIRNDTLAKPGDTTFYYTDAISDSAVQMIDDAVPRNQPFFVYVAYTAPHWPLHALEEDIAKYEGRYREGWDALRAARHERLKAMGVLHEKWPMSPRDEKAPVWADLSKEQREWEDLRMAVYAAQIDRMDQGVGRIMARLRELQIEENTLVMFLSDNGGCAEFLAEDGHSTRYNIPTLDGKPIRGGNIQGLRPGAADTFMSYGLPWANASNTPFRLYKHWVHEGGISTPFIAHWPAVIRNQAMVHQPCHFIDIMATCLDATGIAYPKSYNGHAIVPLEGESLLPAMQGKPWQRERPILWEHEGNRAVRHDHWKLVSKHPGQWELYDMEADRTELNDLAEGNKSQVAELAVVYEAWAKRCGAMPWEELRRSR